MNRRKKQIIKVGVLTFVFALGVFLLPTGSKQVFAAGSAKVNASTGFIREKADTGSNSVGSVKKGDQLEIIESTTDKDGKTWYKVYVDGAKTGYIRSDLVAVEGNVSEESSTKTENTSNTTDTTESGGNKTVVGSNNTTETVKKEETKTETKVEVVNVSETDVATVKATTDVRVRKGAGTNFDVAGVAKTNTEMTVSGMATDSEGKTWYQVSFNEANKTVNGFVREDLIEVLTHVEPAVEETVEEIPEEIVEEEPIVENSDYHLSYMQNEAGEMEWFLFDNIHGTSQSLKQLLNAVDQMKENELQETEKAATMRMLAIGLGVACAILIVVVTILIFKLRDSYEYEYEDDEEDEEDDDTIDDEEEDEEEDEEDEEKAPRKPLFGLGRKKKVDEEEDDEEDAGEEGDTLTEIQPEKPSKPENKAWQSKDFLELDDDMEFEFLDL